MPPSSRAAERHPHTNETGPILDGASQDVADFLFGNAMPREVRFAGFRVDIEPHLHPATSLLRCAKLALGGTTRFGSLLC